MILRRVIAHFKKQEWTAIAIDFVIVVLGVFVGIQVANWNAARLDHRRGAAFAERLRNDLRIEAWNYEALANYLDDVEANAVTAIAILEGRREAQDEDLLIAAYRATQYAASVRRRATWDELTSTGSVGLIRNQRLRDVAALVYDSTSQGDVREEGQTSRYRIAFRMITPVDVQAALEAQCGDRYTAPGDFGAVKNQLSYPCETGLPPETVEAVAAALRADPSILPLLRLRVADVRTLRGNLTTANRDVIEGLRTLSQEEAP